MIYNECHEANGGGGSSQTCVNRAQVWKEEKGRRGGCVQGAWPHMPLGAQVCKGYASLHYVFL